jgi:hypothetical protein
MKVRATVPFRAYLKGQDPDSLSPSMEFTHKGMQVQLEFSADDVLQLPGELSEYFRRLHGLRLLMTGDEKLQQLASAENGWPLLNLIVRVANRVALAIRNFGRVAHVAPLRVSEAETDRWLRALHIETSDDGQEWKPVRATESLEEMLADRLLLARENIGEMNVSEWAEVEEAVQDDLKAGPEQEFLTNAIEHLRVDNLRLAVVESVICLEIVLTEWLNKVLPNRGIPPARVKELLRPQLDLSTRIGLLLPLLASSAELASIKQDDVVRTIKFRNDIAHRLGNLPDGVDQGMVREGVRAVLVLALRLADNRDRLRRSPELEGIAREVAAAHGVPVPKINVIGRHDYTVGFEFPLDKDFPGDGVLTAVATDLTGRMVQYDARFQPAEKVWIVFKQPTEVIAVWVAGELKKTGKKPLPSVSGILSILERLGSDAPRGGG